MPRIFVYAGSFDPVTVGHEDVIRRAAALCDTLHVVVMYNPNKTGCFTVDNRIELLRKVTADLSNVVVDAWDGLMVDYVRKVDILGKYGYKASSAIQKFDYAHPNASGMDVIASFVYDQVGAWIDENN